MIRPLQGGITIIDSHRSISTSLPVERAPIPQELILPLSQHAGMPANPVVSAGEQVKRGQVIAKAQGFISANIHAPIDSVVTAIEPRHFPHPSGLSAPCIILRPAPDAVWPQLGEAHLQHDDIESYEPNQIRQIIREAGIVGLGGAVFPTSVKVKSGIDHETDTLIINGCECEPWITCDEMLFREAPQQVIAGACLLQQAVKAKKRILAIEDDAAQTIDKLQNAIVDCGDPIELAVLPTRYPSGSERQLIKMITGREVPATGLPADIGVAVFNAGTAAAVFRAVIHHEPLISRYVTITGYGVKQPRVLEVLIGTPIWELIDFCGGYTDDANGLIMGGAMMGLGLLSHDVPVTKAMNCILVTSEEMTKDIQGEKACIRCGECAKACPANLTPQQLLSFIKARDLDLAQKWHLESCINCGCCNAVCPSHIPLVSYFRYAKSEIRALGQAKHKAQIAKQRHEARTARLERAKREREEKMRQKKQALKENKPATQNDNDQDSPVSLEKIRARIDAEKGSDIKEPVE